MDENEKPKKSLLFPLLALGCDAVAVFFLFVAPFLWYKFAEFPLALIGLLSPVVGILLAVYSLRHEKTKKSAAGYIISVVAIVIPVICIVLVILYFSALALIIAGM